MGSFRGCTGWAVFGWNVVFMMPLSSLRDEDCVFAGLFSGGARKPGPPAKHLIPSGDRIPVARCRPSRSNPDSAADFTVPHVAVIAPLTLLSVWLLLSKPRATKRPILAPEISESGNIA